MTAAIRVQHRSHHIVHAAPAPSRPVRAAIDVRAQRRPRPVEVRRAPSPATYRRRRAIVGTVLAVLVAVGAVAAHDVLAGSGGDPASAAESLPAHATSIVALPGDSLWTIADRHRGDIAISRYVDTLVDLNGGASIQAGQMVVLP